MWYRRTIIALYLGWLLCLTRAVVADPSASYTLCADENLLTVTGVQRLYNQTTQIYNFTITGSSSTVINRMAMGANNQYYAAAAHTQLQYGLQILYDNTTELCPDVRGGCPITAGNMTDVSETLSFIPPSSVPLGDIILRYSAWDAYKKSVTCMTMAPIGFQDPTWRLIFIFLPVAFALFAGLVALIAAFATLSEEKFDPLLLMSNFVHLPAAQRLMTPTAFDVIFHAQFVVAMGQLNLAFPKFYPLFTSNFSWSFLLFPTNWLGQTIQNIFPSDTYALLDSGNTTAKGVNVTGTGMANFADATGIAVNGLFLTGIIFFLIIFASCLVLAFALWFFMQWSQNAGPIQDDKMHGVNFITGIGLRVLVLFYLPLATMSFYQLMLPAPWYLLLASSLVLVFPLFLLSGYVSFLILRVRPPSTLYSDITPLLRYGSLYNTFKEEKYRFFISVLVHKILVAAMVSLFQSSGIAQVVVLMVIEAAFVALHYFQWPFADKHINMYHLVYCALRFIIITFNLVHVSQFSVSDYDKQCIAYVQITLQFLIFMSMFLLSVKNLVVMVTGVSDHELIDDTHGPPRMTSWRSKFQKEKANLTTPYPHGYERYSISQQMNDPRLSTGSGAYSSGYGPVARHSMQTTHSSAYRLPTMMSQQSIDHYPHPNRLSTQVPLTNQRNSYYRTSIEPYQAYASQHPPHEL